MPPAPTPILALAGPSLLPSPPPTHLLLRVQVQEVGGIQASVHALLCPGSAGSGTVRPLGAGRSTNSWGSSTSTGGDGALSSFLSRGRGCVSPRAPSPLALSRSGPGGRQGNSPLSLLGGENRGCSNAHPRPPPQSPPKLARLWELCALLKFLFSLWLRAKALESDSLGSNPGSTTNCL